MFPLVFGFGSLEVAVVVVLAVLLFPPRELPKMARTIARAYGQFRRTTDELRRAVMLDDELRKPLDEIRSAYDEARFDLRRSTARIESELRDATRVDLLPPKPVKPAAEAGAAKSAPSTLGAAALPRAADQAASPETPSSTPSTEPAASQVGAAGVPFKLGAPIGTHGRGTESPSSEAASDDAAPATPNEGLV